MKERNITLALLEALADTPVVFVAGARQTGKSTLARHLADHDHPARYVTLDDLTVLAAAQRDPEGFLDGLVGNVVLDEVQRAPNLLVAVKARVDRDRRPGAFLLTGSANVLALPRVADTLVGRMQILTLWPFSQGEIEGSRDRFVDAVFRDEPPSAGPSIERAELCRRIVDGGYPEIQERPRPDRRRAWFQSYVTTLLQRDVRDLAAIEGVAQLPQLLAILAARIGSRVNFSDISRTAGLPQTTLKRYLRLLESLYLVHEIPPWSTNVDARLVKSPKHYLADTGLAADLLGVDADGLASDAHRLGPLLEAFVVNELTKQLGWSETAARLYHFQTHAGLEVDIVIEDRRGRCVAVEVKAARSLGGRASTGIERFADIAGGRFHRGVVLYTGPEVVPLGARRHAVPVSALWRSSQ